MHENGTFTQQLCINIDVEQLNRLIETTLQNLVSDYIAKIADSVDNANTDIYMEDDTLVLDGIKIEGYYSCYKSHATKTTPPEEELSLHPDMSDVNSKEIVEYINENAPEWLRNLVQHIRIHTSDDDIKYNEYEPDWDAMPGGHDSDI